MRNRAMQMWKTLKQSLMQLPLLRRIPQQETPKSKEASLELTLKRSVIYKALLAFAVLVMTIVMLFTMTAAWYKNVAHSSGLIFKVNEWGLDSSVSIQDEIIGAAPGSRGTITMSVENTSDGIISVSPNIARGDMYNTIADMRKRIYFYIDDMVYREGEHTPQLYLNSTTAYTYTVLPNQSLILGEDGNAVPLVWEWVLDVLGYYFYGTVTAESTTADVQEYLRPVEYVFERATFHNGVLETVDGTTTPAEFVQRLSETDGYAGTVTTTVTDSRGHVYYPVSVDDEGKGIWIYLCTLGEIEYENVIDTALGTAEAETDRLFEAYLHILAQQKQMVTTEVNTEAQLAAALNDNTHDMVKLTTNIMLSDTVQIDIYGAEKVLDLNGRTLSSEASTAIAVKESASLTVMNGTLQGAGTSSCYGVLVEGGDVAMSHVILTDAAQGIRISDDVVSNNDSRVTLTNCEIRTTDVTSIFIKGNGPVTASATCLVIEDTLIECDGYYAIAGNGTAGAKGNHGTDIRIRNSTLRARGSAIYHPQRDSRLVVENTVLEAVTPVAIKGGTVEITDCTLTGLSGDEYQDDVKQPAFSGSGYANTGAGVYVETNYDYPCSVAIGGDTTITTVYADAILKYEDTNPQYVITVTGGKYSHDVTAFLAEGYTCSQTDGYWVVSKPD